MNGKVPKGTVDAARCLLADFNHLNVDQVHSIQLRERDANDPDGKVLHLIPIGAVLGVAILPDGQWPEDKDLSFYSMAALGNCLPALGFTAVAPTAFIIAPHNVCEAKK